MSHGSGFVLAKLSGKPGWSAPLPFGVTTSGVGVTIGYSEVGRDIPQIESSLAHAGPGQRWNLTVHLDAQVDTLMVLDTAEAVQEFLKTQVPHPVDTQAQDNLPLGSWCWVFVRCRALGL